MMNDYKRIIPCLDIKEGKTVKGTNFVDLQDAGDPVELAQKYGEQGADELVFLDISATLEKRKTLTKLVAQVAEKVDIPFTVGGGISSVDDVKAVLEAGANKVSINSAAVRNPELIAAIAEQFGKSRLVVAIDAKAEGDENYVYVKGGTKNTGREALDWAKKVESLGAGEVLLTAMGRDGTKRGFDLELTGLLSRELTIPVIASGGAGKAEHFFDLFKKTQASAGLAAGIFHYGELAVADLKRELKTQNIAVQ